MDVSKVDDLTLLKMQGTWFVTLFVHAFHQVEPTLAAISSDPCPCSGSGCADL